MSVFQIKRISDTEYYLGGKHDILYTETEHHERMEVNFDEVFDRHINVIEDYWKYTTWEYDWLTQFGYATFKIHVPMGLTYYSVGKTWSDSDYLNVGMNILYRYFNKPFRDFNIKISKNGNYEKECDYIKIFLYEYSWNSFVAAKIPINKFLELDLSIIESCDWSTVVNYNTSLLPYRGRDDRSYKEFDDKDKLEIVSRLTI